MYFFVSHSSDLDLVQPLVTALESVGHHVFFDGKIKTGEDIIGRLNRELDVADGLLVVWSSNSATSPIVRDELHGFYMRHRAGRPLIFIKRDDNPVPALFSARLYMHHDLLGDAACVKLSGQITDAFGKATEPSHVQDANNLSELTADDLAELLGAEKTREATLIALVRSLDRVRLPMEVIDPVLSLGLAERFPNEPQTTMGVVHAANHLRVKSLESDERPENTLVRRTELSPNLSARNFWGDVTHLCALNGSRMVACLLAAVLRQAPLPQWDDETAAAIRAVLQELLRRRRSRTA